MAERCMVCYGSGKYAPMGGILVKCIHCDAGFVSDEKALENRLKIQACHSGNNPAKAAPTTIPINVSINPMIAQDSVTVSTHDIESIKAKMLADAIVNPAEMDKRSKAYKAWKMSQES